MLLTNSEKTILGTDIFSIIEAKYCDYQIIDRGFNYTIIVNPEYSLVHSKTVVINRIKDYDYKMLCTRGYRNKLISRLPLDIEDDKYEFIPYDSKLDIKIEYLRKPQPLIINDSYLYTLNSKELIELDALTITEPLLVEGDVYKGYVTPLGLITQNFNSLTTISV